MFILEWNDNGSRDSFDAYASYTGEDRATLLQRIFRQVIEELKEKYANDEQFSAQLK